MYAIFIKEINLFFSSLIGYISIAVFLILMGLFLWVFPDTSILDYGYASFDSLFSTAPLIFLFLIPAITMRSFSEELQSGTIEFLQTRPVSQWEIVLGKYFATVILVIFALIPCLIYYYTVYNLAAPVGNVDSGAFWGSYIGLMLLGSSFAAIGVFVSALTKNQIVAFIIAVFLCFVFYLGIDYISKLPIFYGSIESLIQSFGFQAHFYALGRGIIDTRDILYFITVIFVFLFLTKSVLESKYW
jgi:ABC-2 type transport system permease protein